MPVIICHWLRLLGIECSGTQNVILLMGEYEEFLRVV